MSSDSSSITAVAQQNAVPATTPHSEYSTDARSRPSSNTRYVEPEDKTIHILGLGAVGKLIAHSLRGIPDPPPITLITNRGGLVAEWRRSKDKAIVVAADGQRTAETGYNVELAVSPLRAFGIEIDDPDFVWKNPDGLLPHEAAIKLQEMKRGREVDSLSDIEPRQLQPDESDSPISQLILTTKAHLAVSALSSVRHRLSRDSTICLLQNGMGVTEELNEHVFPDPATRPNYMLGIVSHGVNQPPGSSPWFAVHAGAGTIALTVLPRTDKGSAETNLASTVVFSRTSRYLMRTLTRTPVLAAIGVPPTEFLQQKLEKLAQNAVINPLTAMLDARNGAVVYNYAMTRVMRLLLAEISLVLRSLPELRGLPNVQTRFSAERLETLTVGIANQTRGNVSSMLADVRNGRQTEVRYINGYVVKKGEEMGIATVCNYMVLQMVLGKAKVIQDEAREGFSEGAVGDAPGKG